MKKALLPLLGMRDLLPPAAAARRALGRRLIETMASHGYELVTTPAFEREEVLALGLASVGGADIIRFVEPDTGDVAAIRPDMTPQIARIVATRLRDRPAPWRLSYEGTVVRRRRGRARRHRQIAQAGFELIGVAGPRGDTEVVRVAVEAARRAGLERLHVELGHVGIAATALAPIADETARSEVADALGRKDGAEVESLARAAGATRKTIERLLFLARCYGDVDVLDAAAARLRDPPSSAALAALSATARAVVDELGSRGLTVGCDLGDVRAQGYYGGVEIELLAEGPGEPLGSGGRYDGVLSRFGLPPLPATGFALDLDNLEWALEHGGRAAASAGDAPRLVVGGAPDEVDVLAASLRRAGAVAASVSPDGNAGDELEQLVAYAVAWRYDGVALVGARGVRVVRTDPAATRTDAARGVRWRRADAREIVAIVRGEKSR